MGHFLRSLYVRPVVAGGGTGERESITTGGHRPAGEFLSNSSSVEYAAVEFRAQFLCHGTEPACSLHDAVCRQRREAVDQGRQPLGFLPELAGERSVLLE